MNKFAVLLVVSILFFVNSVSAVSMSSNAFFTSEDDKSIDLYHGQRASVTVTFSNENSFCNEDFTVVRTDTGEQIYQTTLGGGSSDSTSFTVVAPSSASGTKEIGVEVTAVESRTLTCDGKTNTTSYSLSLNYEASPQEKAAQNAIDDADSRISEANNLIGQAESKIDRAQSMGASVSEAESDLSSARNSLNEANNYLSRAESALQNNNFQSAQNYAETAQNKARSAVSNANTAIDEAQSAIQQLESKAQDKIADVESKLEDLRTSISTLESTIEKARSNGLDVSDEERKLEDYRGLLSEVESSLDEARNSLDNGNYGTALNKAEEALQQVNSALDNVRSTVSKLGGSIPDSGSSSVSPSIERTVKGLLSADQAVSQEQAELKANNFERKDTAITPSSGPTYSAEMIYTHPSGETVTLSSTVNTKKGVVSDVSLSGDPSQINQKWKETQSAQQTRNSILMFAGAAMLLIISGVFAYYFVNPVNKTVNNFVGEEGESGSGRTFNCSNCDAPISPDDLEDGECPYCGATVSV